MGLLDRIRSVLTNQEVCPPEHLEGYRRIGEQVYEAKVELVQDANPRVRLLIRVAEAFQVMGNALLRDVLSEHEGSSSPIAEITHEQAERWFGHIPDLIINARRESISPGSSNVSLPIQMAERIESEQVCPLSHLVGLRRAANELEDLVTPDMSRIRLQKDNYRETLLLYEEARTWRNTGDALIGSIMSGQRVPHETHEDAKEQYWKALSNYLLVLQGIEDNSLLSALLSPKSKLDSDDVWKVTSRLAILDIRESQEVEDTQRKLEDFWMNHVVHDGERLYESTVERLLREGAIEENGYWYRIPFQPVYRVLVARVEVHHKTILSGQEFVWDYLDGEAGKGLFTRPSFRYADKRDH